MGCFSPETNRRPLPGRGHKGEIAFSFAGGAMHFWPPQVCHASSVIRPQCLVFCQRFVESSVEGRGLGIVGTNAGQVSEPPEGVQILQEVVARVASRIESLKLDRSVL